MEITIKEKTYTIKYTIRALFIYEQIKKEPFALKTITDYYLFFYCLLVANGAEFTFEEFINTLDENPEIATSMMQFLQKQDEKNDMFVDKKKVTEKV